jgi:hypothetical protein
MTGMSEWVVAMRFSVPEVESDRDVAAAFTEEASGVARLMAGFEGCRGVDVARASDDPALWILTSRWSSVGDYRRALSAYEMKVHGVPFLSQAIDEPTAFEVMFTVSPEGERAASGDLASDAGTIDRSR